MLTHAETIELLKPLRELAGVGFAVTGDTRFQGLDVGIAYIIGRLDTSAKQAQRRARVHYEALRDELARDYQPSDDDYEPLDPDEAEALLNEIMDDRPAPGMVEHGAYAGFDAWATAETEGAY